MAARDLKVIENNARDRLWNRLCDEIDKLRVEVVAPLRISRTLSGTQISYPSQAGAATVTTLSQVYAPFTVLDATGAKGIGGPVLGVICAGLQLNGTFFKLLPTINNFVTPPAPYMINGQPVQLVTVSASCKVWLDLTCGWRTIENSTNLISTVGHLVLATGTSWPPANDGGPIPKPACLYWPLADVTLSGTPTAISNIDRSMMGNGASKDFSFYL